MNNLKTFNSTRKLLTGASLLLLMMVYSCNGCNSPKTDSSNTPKDSTTVAPMADSTMKKDAMTMDTTKMKADTTKPTVDTSKTEQAPPPTNH
jgi:hypothetical protein